MPRECSACWADACIAAARTGRAREDVYRQLLRDRDREADQGTLEDGHA